MIKIGLVGEAPNDTQAIKNILHKKYPKENVNIFFMLQRITGSQLDSQKTKNFLRKEYEFNKPDIIIFIRDLDSVLPNKQQKDKLKLYFSESNSVVDGNGIFLLHIYEIEALILSDINTFNKIYETEIVVNTDVMTIEEPKEFLKRHAKKYSESHNAKIFEQLSFDELLKCGYFKIFIDNLEKKITN